MNSLSNPCVIQNFNQQCLPEDLRPTARLRAPTSRESGSCLPISPAKTKANRNLSFFPKSRAESRFPVVYLMDWMIHNKQHLQPRQKNEKLNSQPTRSTHFHNSYRHRHVPGTPTDRPDVDPRVKQRGISSSEKTSHRTENAKTCYRTQRHEIHQTSIAGRPVRPQHSRRRGKKRKLRIL